MHREDLLKKVLEVHRTQRHDFMNHLQIIYGYLELGKADMAKKYTLKIADDLREAGKFSKIPLPCLQSYLLWFSAQLANSHLSFEIEWEDSCQEWMEQNVDEQLTGLFMELFSIVQGSLKNMKIKCSLKFKEKHLSVDLHLCEKKDKIKTMERINTAEIQGLNLLSEQFSVVCKEYTPQKLGLAISLIKV